MRPRFSAAPSATPQRARGTVQPCALFDAAAHGLAQRALRGHIRRMSSTKRIAEIEIDSSLSAALDDAVARFGSLDALASAVLADYLADRMAERDQSLDEKVKTLLRERAAEAYEADTLSGDDVFAGLKAKYRPSAARSK